MSAFKFALGQQVQITCSAESGKVTGRAEYAAKENQYFLLYKGADGRAVHDWWDESALTDFVKVCQVCNGTGRARIPYSTEYGACSTCGNS